MSPTGQTVSAIARCAEKLQNEVDAMQKRLEALEMNVELMKSEKISLQDDISKLQQRNEEDDKEITNMLYEREVKRLEQADGKNGASYALAAHEAADEVQRKEKLIELERLFVGSLEKRLQSLPIEISNVDAAIESAHAELVEVLERTGMSSKSIAEILASLEKSASMEEFFRKGEETYQSDMRRIAELKKEIEDQNNQQKILRDQLNAKADAVDALLEENRVSNALKLKIAKAENDIRVKDRDVQARTKELEAQKAEKKVVDAELEAADTHSKYLQARFSLKEDTDYLNEQIHAHNAAIHDLKVTKKGQMSHTGAIDRSMGVLDKAAKVVGVQLPALHSTIKAKTCRAPLVTDVKTVMEKYSGEVEFYKDNAFANGSEENIDLRDDYLCVIAAAHETLAERAQQQTVRIDEKYAELAEFTETLEKKRADLELEAQEQSEELLHTAQHKGDLKQKICVQQQEMLEGLQEPMRRRLNMQRKLTESRYPVKR